MFGYQNPNLTFAELHQRAGQQGFRDLYITGTNLTQQRVEVFSHETYPQLRIADAIRISMSVPLYFRAVLLNSIGNVVKKMQAGKTINVFVDGGIAANFPMTIFDSTKYKSPIIAPNELFDNPETLGIRLVRSAQVAQFNSPVSYPIDSFGSYIGAFYNMVIDKLNPVKGSHRARIISINSLHLSPKIKHISLKQKQQLLESGRLAAERFFLVGY